jgi:hypothetical protein
MKRRNDWEGIYNKPASLEHPDSRFRRGEFLAHTCKGYVCCCILRAASGVRRSLLFSLGFIISFLAAVHFGYTISSLVLYIPLFGQPRIAWRGEKSAMFVLHWSLSLPAYILELVRREKSST